MMFLLLGYSGAAAAFYFLIAKTARVEPEFLVASHSLTRGATIIEFPERTEKRVA